VARFRLNVPHVVEYWQSRAAVRLETGAEIDSSEMPRFWRPSVLMTPLDPEAEIMWRNEIDRLRRATHGGSVPVIGPLHHLPGGELYEAMRRKETTG
jgi:hypothetical protein